MICSICAFSLIIITIFINYTYFLSEFPKYNNFISKAMKHLH